MHTFPTKAVEVRAGAAKKQSVDGWVLQGCKGVYMSIKDVAFGVVGLVQAVVGAVLPSSSAEDRATRVEHDYEKATSREERGSGNRAVEREISSRRGS